MPTAVVAVRQGLLLQPAIELQWMVGSLERVCRILALGRESWSGFACSLNKCFFVPGLVRTARHIGINGTGRTPPSLWRHILVTLPRPLELSERRTNDGVISPLLA